MPLSDRTLSRRTSLRAFVDGVSWSGYSAAVSLHAHTSYSREVLSDLPVYASRIPIVGALLERELDDCRARSAAVDFTKGWWHPPVGPRAVFESEAAQIDRRFGLDSFVSVTDHDDIAAGLELQRLFAPRRAPISVEWTVPFAEGFFHLGVHNLPPASAAEWLARLSAFTARSGGESLPDLLEGLHRADVLIVFNHPWWDLAGIGERTHAVRLREFLDAHQSRLHALEINGYRSRKENGRVRGLSADRGLPLVSGGDRHALAPNAVLNVTGAASFAEFAAEVHDGASHVVVMPEYRQHLSARILAAASDVMASSRAYPPGWRQWTDRVSCDWRGCVRPLSYHWPRGGPLWVRSSVAAFRVLTSPLPLRLLRATLQRLDGPAPISPIPTLS
jgi:hypothetical protein